ncbi:MFS transporter [Rhodococcus sp. F64268]|uniref:MFS transporter n=1 Tax=unclassified Rhodococcus (in: high G+C Gram-positive bacteria) TaxID=192944 RepID=UPI0027E0FFF2|nr:MFS transporter [Rhodococcus sp. F64268]
MRSGDEPAVPDAHWAALTALCLGFFMILVDSTIVSVANPAIMRALEADLESVVWVTSAYLLAFAVPLMITGRLGDRFGQRRIYLSGLVVFTFASLWCGMSSSIETLIAARVLQGFGAALMSPQTMAVITRVFPSDRRGMAMGIWGAIGGVATLVGPLAGGVLVDGFGWEWIFFVNIPIGLAGFVLALRFVPALPTQAHRFDVPGVVLSGVGMFFLVFGLQGAGESPWSSNVWTSVGIGVVFLVIFVWYQSLGRDEPLVPLTLFRDRNFALANIGIASIGFAITAFMLPLMFYAQDVRGLDPTESALLMIPMAVLSGAFAPFVGRLVDRVHPRYVAGPGFALLAVAFVWLSLAMTPDAHLWQLLMPIGLTGFASAGVWSTLSTTATRNLDPRLAGAGSGVYNATRQLGAVLGSAAMAAVMAASLSRRGLGSGLLQRDSIDELPGSIREAYAVSMAHSMWLPAAALTLGFLASACFARPPRVEIRGIEEPSSPARM